MLPMLDVVYASIMLDVVHAGNADSGYAFKMLDVVMLVNAECGYALS
jgi:hypothetical protein